MFFIPTGTRELTERRLFPYVNVGLVLVNVCVFIYELTLIATGGDAALTRFINNYALIPATVTDGTPLALGALTSMFLHGGLLHILGNMIYLLPFGDNIEDRLGHVRYLFFYLLCGLIAAYGFALLYPSTTTPLLGASGAIAGVLGGYLALHPRGVVKGFFFIIILFLRVDLPAVVFIGYWFLLQVFSSVVSFGGSAQETGSVAFAAHVVGFIAGILLAPLFALTVRKQVQYSK
jgi:membrane associated rhomboid family serine protease